VADLLVLCYHGVADGWEPAVPVAALRRQLALLLGRGYVPSTFTQAVLDPPAARTLAVTFDDGYRSVLERARPVLEELGVPATVFVATAFVGTPRAAWPGTDHWLGTEHERELDMLSWTELAQLAGEHWEIGSHTCTHPRLTQLRGDEVAQELAAARAEVAERVGACTAVAYPYGDVDARVVRAAAEAGYRAGCTLPTRFHYDSALAVPRVGVYRRDGDLVFRVKVSPLVRRWRRTRVWTLLRPELWRRKENRRASTA
jgi:peptidoglycan/xylan/chitin deacetylase (PgdA/CDA1 family)